MRTRLTTRLFMLVAMAPVMIFWSCNRKNDTAVEAKTPKNLVIIVSDALRRDELGCYGGNVTTPNIDRLAREGTLFENAYSTSPSTLPSSVAMLTGEYSNAIAFANTTRSRNDSASEDYLFMVPDVRVLLAEKIKEKGYATAASVENRVLLHSNVLQGFQLVDHRMVEELVDNVGSGPFYLLKWFMDPHGPYSPPEKYSGKFDVDWESLPRKQGFYTTAWAAELGRLLRNGKLTHAELDAVRALYRAEVEWMDERVGRILSRLEQSGALEHTIIVFTADHGEMLGKHNKIGHGKQFWETLVNVPLIFHGPGIPRGKRVDAVVSHISLVPTLEELLGMEADGINQGQSYAAVFRGEDIPSQEAFFDAAPNNFSTKWESTCALLLDGYKLVVNPGGKRGTMDLYHPVKSPDESLDLSALHPEQVSRLYRRIKELRSDNLRRRRVNLNLFPEDLDFSEELRKTRDTLRTLGYIQ